MSKFFVRFAAYLVAVMVLASSVTLVPAEVLGDEPDVFYVNEQPLESVELLEPDFEYEPVLDELLPMSVSDCGLFEYTLGVGDATITRYIGTQADADIVITTVDGHTVVAIGTSAFAQARIRSIEIPGSVRTIGESAFRESTLQNLILNEGLVTIGRGAFFGNISLETLDIPNSVTTINSAVNSNTAAGSWDWAQGRWTRTFGGNTALTSVTIGTGLQAIQPGTFLGNTALRTVNLGRVTSVGTRAFMNNTGIEEINWSNELETIAGWAFTNNGQLTSLNLPEGLRTIGAEAFAWNSAITTVEIPGSVTSIGESAQLSHTTTEQVTA